MFLTVQAMLSIALGVWVLASRIRRGFAHHPVYGFDSFRGLDEDWGRHGATQQRGLRRERKTLR